ncbi:MAG: hypothetical protein EG825_11615 [Rhodocyclaceae bacterium]|nr:hypothetical protein [Rhodocyclaceae bacterium]
MLSHLHQRDPTGEVDLHNTEDVREAITAILMARFGATPAADFGLLNRALDDVARAYRGDYPGLLRCDTPYHDLRHAFDTGLTMARLLDGYNQRHTGQRIGLPLCQAAIVLALFHDIGFLRRPNEATLTGAALVRDHEQRGVDFLAGYLSRAGVTDSQSLAKLVLATHIHYTLPDTLPPHERTLSNLLGTADLLSQLSDRCYLEKCRDFLFAEFAAAGLAAMPDSPYPTPEALLKQTPEFYRCLLRSRLNKDFDQAYLLLDAHFGGDNTPYQDAIQRNLDYLAAAIEAEDFSRLRRQPHSLIDAE